MVFRLLNSLVYIIEAERKRPPFAAGSSDGTAVIADRQLFERHEAIGRQMKVRQLIG